MAKPFTALPLQLGGKGEGCARWRRPVELCLFDGRVVFQLKKIWNQCWLAKSHDSTSGMGLFFQNRNEARISFITARPIALSLQRRLNFAHLHCLRCPLYSATAINYNPSHARRRWSTNSLYLLHAPLPCYYSYIFIHWQFFSLRHSCHFSL